MSIALTGAHSFFMPSRAFSRAYSLLAASEMLSNLGMYGSRFMSTNLLRQEDSSGRTEKPTISEILSQWRSRRPGLKRVWTSGKCSLNSSTFDLTWNDAETD